jgi:dihydrofolate reductase
LHYYRGEKTIVVTRLNNYKGGEGTGTACIDRTSFRNNLKRKEGKNIRLIGGSELVSSIQNENLIDEYNLFIHPMMSGCGIPLFHNLRFQAEPNLISYKKIRVDRID